MDDQIERLRILQETRIWEARLNEQDMEAAVNFFHGLFNGLLIVAPIWFVLGLLLKWW